MRSSTRIATPAHLESIALRVRSLATRMALSLANVLVGGFLVVSGVAQGQVAGPPEDLRDIPTSLPDTFDRVNIRNRAEQVHTTPKPALKDDTCLLPPLTLVHSPTVGTTALQIPEKAKQEYREACAALKHKKTADAEKHLRKATQEYPQYSAAWVTLGQILAAQQKQDEARSACSQGATVDSGYVPAYLCLADLAAHQKSWDELRRLSSRALELDPTANAIAYEYNAAANLRTNKLDDAEKSGLRAVEIDTDHREPRVYFVLAQIYEAKGEPAKEAAQLREYLKYAESPNDVAVVTQYLSKLEEQIRKNTAVGDPSGKSSTAEVVSSTESWGPADIDESVPPVRTDLPCPLPQILKETSKRTEDLIEDLQRFSATESIEQIEIGKNGKRHNSASQLVNYIAQIEQKSSGYPRVEEYRFGSNGIRQASLVDTGTAAFALLFHPTHLGSFDFRCEGLSELRAFPAWQVHFEESADPAQAFQSLRIGRSLYLPRLKGRAWIATDNYAVLRIETDLVSPIPEIGLQLEHLIIVYAPVEFQKSHVRLWLPESASLYIDHHGRRYERVHSFSHFQLFSVDAAEAIKDPVAGKDGTVTETHFSSTMPAPSGPSPAVYARSDGHK